MLSFDITDRNIRVIRGNESGGKIRILSSATIEIDEGAIINGFIRDIPQMATIINTTLKNNRMLDKEAVISISSNLVVFKELHIPKAKPAQFKTMVQNQMLQTISVTDEHSISYTIAGEIKDGGNDCFIVLATACPRTVVDCYRKVFSMLGITLRNVAVSCNCISRLVLADNTIKDKMPLLLVQIDTNFININLYEKGQLAFSRFASISADDYDDKEDYVFQAVNENIFRMIQFQRTRSSDAIRNVIFYGDTTQYIRLTNSLEQMEIRSSLLKIPFQLSGYENLEFSLFANAIGAMFKRQKDIESINLLEVDVGTTKQIQVSGSSLGLQIGVVFGISAVIVGIGYGVLSFLNNGIKAQISDIDTYITSEQISAQLAEIDKSNLWIDKLNEYKTQISVVKSGFDSQPVLRTEVFDQLDNCLSGASIGDITYSDGDLTLACSASNQSIPSTFVEKLFTTESNFFSCAYIGYESGSGANAENIGASPSGTTFAIGLKLNGDTALGKIPEIAVDTQSEGGEAE